MSLSEDVDTLARTIYGEARGEPFQGQVAVAWVVRNRVNAHSWYGSDVIGVCRKPLQFSCWNTNDPNFGIIEAATLDTPGFVVATGVACIVLTGNFPDPTNGATNYYASSIPAPGWAAAMVPTAEIGHHKFFKEVQ
jgi:N-acetylmuramoyl-L-alanine amidase